MSSSTPNLPIVIIGAGIAGLSLARTLHQRGIPFEIYESQRQDHSVGYGITLRSWAWRPLLEVLGKDEQELRRKTSTDSPIGGIGHIDQIFYDAYTGQKLVDATRNDDIIYRANRVAIRKFLLEGIDENKIHWEATLLRVSQETDGSVLAVFTDGTTVRARLLVAADGVHSAGKSKSLVAILVS